MNIKPLIMTVWLRIFDGYCFYYFFLYLPLDNFPGGEIPLFTRNLDLRLTVEFNQHSTGVTFNCLASNYEFRFRGCHFSLGCIVLYEAYFLFTLRNIILNPF